MIAVFDFSVEIDIRNRLLKPPADECIKYVRRLRTFDLRVEMNVRSHVCEPFLVTMPERRV